VNEWNDQAKLLWLEVRLVGKARKAWNRLTTEEKSTYDAAVAALRRRFEPESKRDLYAAEFQTRERKLNRGVRHLWKSRTLAQKSLEITREINGNQKSSFTLEITNSH